MHGVGKAMRSETDNVMLVDGDLSGRRNMAILFDAVRTLDGHREGSSIGLAEVAGLTIAELAASYDAAFTIDFDQVEALAASVHTSHCTIVDAPIPFAAPVRPFIVRATRFIIVTEPTLLGVASARTMIAELKRFGVPITRIILVTNCRDGNAAASRNEIERALEAKVSAELPPASDRRLRKGRSCAAEMSFRNLRRAGD